MSDRMKSVVVVGGGGYIGFHIGLNLLRQGKYQKVSLFDLRAPDPEWFPEGEEHSPFLPFFHGSVLSLPQLTQAFLKVKANSVVHCASYGMSGEEQVGCKNWELTEGVNVGGTCNVIKACRMAGVQSLVYTSTFNVVFGGRKIVDGDESLPYFPLHLHHDHYSRTKAIAEQLVLMVDGSSSTGGKELRTCALRLGGVIGVKEKRHLPRIVASLPALKFIYAPHIKVQFVSISNVCQAHSKAMSKLWEAPEIVGGQAYFISDGKPIGNFEYFRPLITGLGYSFPRIQMPLWILWLVVYLSTFVLNLLSWISPSLTFRPFLTPCELLKTSVTHYFSIEKARMDLNYVPHEANDLRPVVRYYQQKLNKLG